MAVAAAVVAVVTGSGLAWSAPLLEVPVSVVPPGTSIVVSGAGWPTDDLVQIEICGNQGSGGSPDCLLSGAVDVAPSADGALATRLTVAAPPSPCPCIVQARALRHDVTARKPLLIEGAVAREIASPPEAPEPSLAAAEASTPPPAQEPRDGRALPTWPIALVGVIGLGLGATVRRRRHRVASPALCAPAEDISTSRSTLQSLLAELTHLTASVAAAATETEAVLAPLSGRPGPSANGELERDGGPSSWRPARPRDLDIDFERPTAATWQRARDDLSASERHLADATRDGTYDGAPDLDTSQPDVGA
jgi:hypothetical protein